MTEPDARETQPPDPGPREARPPNAGPRDASTSEAGLFETVRALAFAMPLAILAVAVVAPPDPVRQLGLTVVALALAWPLSRRIVGKYDVRAHTLVAFFLAIAGIVLLGLWGLSWTALEGVAARAGRGVVVLVGVGFGYWLVIVRSGLR